jgi:hypothetical protein
VDHKGSRKDVPGTGGIDFMSAMGAHGVTFAVDEQDGTLPPRREYADGYPLKPLADRRQVTAHVLEAEEQSLGSPQNQIGALPDLGNDEPVAV